MKREVYETPKITVKTINADDIIQTSPSPGLSVEVKPESTTGPGFGRLF